MGSKQDAPARFVARSLAFTAVVLSARLAREPTKLSARLDASLITPLTMRKSFRPRLLLLGAVAVLFAVGVLVLFLGRTPPPSPLPNPNGYDDLLKAARAVSEEITAVTDLDRDGLRALVATNAAVLELLRAGLARRCAVPTDAHLADFKTMSRDLIGLKALARGLSAEGRLAEMENRPADAARSYLDAIRLGTAMSRGGFVINRLVGIECEAAGEIPLAALLPRLTCQQMRPLLAQLEQIDGSPVPWQEVMQNTRHSLRAQRGSHPNPFKFLAALWQARSSIQAAEKKHELAAAHLRLLTVELALRCYRCDHGTGPDSLARLVPRYLQRLPSDPFSGGPPVYRPAGTNWLLYSLGPDRVDDGGRPGQISSGDYPIGLDAGNSRQAHRTGDLLYDSPW